MVALEDSDFAVLGDSVDLNQVPALPVGNTVGYVKQATLVMIQHLNQFSQMAEERLRQISSSISRLETELTILESKLTSIPGLDSIKPSVTTTDVRAENTAEPGTTPAQSVQPSNSAVPPPAPPTAAVPIPPAPPVSAAPAAPAPPAAVESSQPAAAASPDPAVLTVQKDPVYSRYFKMLQVGVPAQAVKLKMQSEGLDPNLLDTPNAPAPAGRAQPEESDESGSEDSD